MLLGELLQTVLQLAFLPTTKHSLLKELSAKKTPYNITGTIRPGLKVIPFLNECTLKGNNSKQGVSYHSI